jgi:hypothetical protein
MGGRVAGGERDQAPISQAARNPMLILAALDDREPPDRRWQVRGGIGRATGLTTRDIVKRQRPYSLVDRPIVVTALSLHVAQPGT